MADRETTPRAESSVLSHRREPTGKLAPQPWMTSPETAQVMAALTADGNEARFVGGCVRDALLKRPVKDIDIATPAPPATVMSLMERAGIRVIPTGLDHGTVTAVINQVHYEITTLRQDVRTDGRWAEVAFTPDWTADAARRDFTINALSCTLDGDIYDPYGGLDDLGHGRVRFVGNPRQRIEEDVLRLLRFFRIYAYYGEPPPDHEGLAACRQMAPRLPELSGERVRGELFRILMAPNPADIVHLMAGERILEQILPEAGDVGPLRQLSWLEDRAIRMDSVAPDEIRRLAVVVRTDAAGAAAIADRLRLSNIARRRLVALAAPALPVHADLDPRARRRALHHLGAATVTDVALQSWARERALSAQINSKRSRQWLDLLAEAEAWTPQLFPLKGRDALDLGVRHGRQVGDLLQAVEAWWEDGDFQADRDACLAQLKMLVAAPD